MSEIEFLKQFVAIPSVSTNETEAARFLLSEMSQFCDEAFIDEAGNAVGKLGNGETKVYFLGHIDTVPGDIPVKIEDGRLFGRGSVDAKGSFATAVMAAKRLSDEVLQKISLTLIGAVEEEVGSSKGARYALRAYDEPDYLIIGEPSGFDAVTLGYKGRLIAKILKEKDNFHSAGDDSTAAEDLIEAWTSLKKQAEDFNKDKEKIFEKLQISIQEFNTESDGLKQRAKAVIGYRLPLSVSPGELEEKIMSLKDFKIEIAAKEIAYRSARATGLARAFRNAIREHGRKPRLKLKTGTSDMNVVAPSWGMPMLAYGPGDSSLDHRPDEHLLLAEYEKAIAILATALKNLAFS